jgi:hypothetical protein
MAPKDSSTSPPEASSIDPRVLQEMDRFGLAVVKMRLAAALHQGRDRVPVQREGVPGASPTCAQVIEWVRLKESKKNQRERRVQLSTLIFAALAAIAAVSSALIPADALDAALLRFIQFF